MKRVLAAAMAVLMALGAAAPALAEDWKELGEMAAAVLEETGEAQPAAAVEVGDSLPARSAILMEQTTGKVLFAKNEHEALPPASVTKVMTLLLVMEAIDRGSLTLESQVSCSGHAAGMGGSQIWLEPGEVMTVDQLLRATAIASANDAAVALGEAVAGTEEAFVQMMNRRAQELGMSDTLFHNATGLDAQGHVTSAHDIALMSAELMKYPLIREYTTVWMSDLRGGETQLVNTNRLIRTYDGATGLKTGTTSGAGSCLTATATRGELSLVAVVMGCPTSDERFASGKALLDYGFANYTCWTPEVPQAELLPVAVKRGVERLVEVACLPEQGFIVEKGQVEQITQRVELAESIEAPVEEGRVVGRVVVLAGETELGEYPITAAAGVRRMTFPLAMGMLWQQMRAMA